MDTYIRWKMGTFKGTCRSIVVATQIFFSCSTPDPWANDPIWGAYFSNGLVQPPAIAVINSHPIRLGASGNSEKNAGFGRAQVAGVSQLEGGSKFSRFQKGVSKNRGTPKWMVYNRKPYQNGWFGCTTIFGNIQNVKLPFFLGLAVFFFFFWGGGGRGKNSSQWNWVCFFFELGAWFWRWCHFASVMLHICFCKVGDWCVFKQKWVRVCWHSVLISQGQLVQVDTPLNIKGVQSWNSWEFFSTL